MSEKRFTSNGQWIAEGTIVDICDNGKVIMQVFDNDNIQNVVDLLNEQQGTIEELRLQEKEKGVPVFVVREGKNPIALFFNEQRASLYCQEHMANLTYQKEKWCRVE